MEVEQIKDIVKNYIETIYKLLELSGSFDIEVEQKPDAVYCYINGNSDDMRIMIGKEGKNAIAVRKLLPVLLKKYKISQRVKIVFSKK